MAKILIEIDDNTCELKVLEINGETAKGTTQGPHNISKFTTGHTIQCMEPVHGPGAGGGGDPCIVVGGTRYCW